MNTNGINLVGLKIGKLSVIEELKERRNGSIVWKCKCDCGNYVNVRGDLLRGKITKSCGCLLTESNKNRAKHGYTGTMTHKCWSNIIDRCYNTNNNRYKHYGKRGIKVCDRWLGENGFVNFLEDMGEKPKKLSIDRIDNDGNYEPSNCRWATYSQQNRNRSI